MRLFRFLFRRRIPDWEAVRWKLHKDVDWHNKEQGTWASRGFAQRASEHRVAAQVLWGIAEALSYGMNADEKDLKR